VLFIIYVVTFHVMWAACPFLIFPRLQATGERTLLYAVANLTIRLIVWVAPVLLLLRGIDGVEPLEYLKLRPNIVRGVVIGLVLTALNLLGTCARSACRIPRSSASPGTAASGRRRNRAIDLAEDRQRESAGPGCSHAAPRGGNSSSPRMIATWLPRMYDHRGVLQTTATVATKVT